jgi:hypothetical protein
MSTDGLQYEELKTELNRRKNQSQKMLQLFKEKGELTTVDLMRIGTGCSSRLKTLRKDGHIITAQYVKPGKWKYIYLGERKELGN